MVRFLVGGDGCGVPALPLGLENGVLWESSAPRISLPPAQGPCTSSAAALSPFPELVAVRGPWWLQRWAGAERTI